MELGFFTQPNHAPGRTLADTMEEDREIFRIADRLGYVEGFIGEHMSAERENVPNALLFIASLADSTNTIRLGTGMHNLPFSHPLVVASNVAWVDQLLKGRFLFGIGAGVTPTDAEALEVLRKDRRAMTDEAVNHILALWSGEAPYNLVGEFWNIAIDKTRWPEMGLGVVPMPYQQPHPPFLFGAGEARSERLGTLGGRGWWMLSSDTLPPTRLAEQWAAYAAGTTAAGRTAERKHWRIVRSIFVADESNVAKDYAKANSHSPYRHHFAEFHEKFTRLKKLDMFKGDPAMADENVTLDYALDACVIAGTVDEVVEQILALRELAGPFGTLVYAGKDWADPALSKRSMELMAERVMPAVNAAIGPEPWDIGTAMTSSPLQAAI